MSRPHIPASPSTMRCWSLPAQACVARQCHRQLHSAVNGMTGRDRPRHPCHARTHRWDVCSSVVALEGHLSATACVTPLRGHLALGRQVLAGHGSPAWEAAPDACEPAPAVRPAPAAEGTQHVCAHMGSLGNDACPTTTAPGMVGRTCRQNCESSSGCSQHATHDRGCACRAQCGHWVASSHGACCPAPV